MEKLSRRSDGVYETPTGQLAIVPRAISGQFERNGQIVAWFEFKAGFQSGIQRVEWPVGAPAIAVQADTARTMMANNYAFNIDDAIMDDWNAAVEAVLAKGSDQLREDGPTVEDWVKQGYRADHYPPQGFASKSTPEAIAAAVEAQKVPATPAAPVAPADAPNAPPAVPDAPAVPAAPAAPEVPNAETAQGKKGKQTPAE